MSKTVLKLENVSKQYRLGQIGTGTLSHDLNRWWAKSRGKEDPFSKVGAINDRTLDSGDNYVWALKDINLDVKQGEILGVIGKNGAGKSTLLKLLSQVTQPSAGSIKVKGRIASLLEVGTGFHPELTGRENVFLNGAILGMTKREIKSKLDEIVDFAGVAKYLDTPTKRYSSGMTVRLGFAIAAYLEPEILVVDEVLAVGDAEFQKKAIGKMQDVSQDDGRTVLFVSHNMESILSLCPKSILLKNGMLDSIGESSEIVQYYAKLNTSISAAFSKDSIKNQTKSIILLDFSYGNTLDCLNNRVNTGSNLIFKATFLNTGEINDIICPVIVINDQYNQRITALSSLLLKQKFQIKEGSFAVIWELENCNLAASNYLLDIFIVDSVASGQKIFEADSIVNMNLGDSDFYGTGVTNAKRDKVYFPFTINVIQ
jgi:lipopolysaccharide transport system ATP-binding protein